MKILNGGKKDYYDYLPGIYGIDQDVVYDRAQSHVFRRLDAGEEYFITDYVLYCDKPKEDSRIWIYENGKGMLKTVSSGLILHIVIEVGYVQYLFKVERYLGNNGKPVVEPKLLDKFTVTEKKSTAPIAVIPVEYSGWYKEAPSIRSYRMDREIKNPIFSGTWVTSLIPAEEMYNEVYNYLISIREPKIEDNRTDVQKLESKGFDRTTSFRNPINKRRK